MAAVLDDLLRQQQGVLTRAQARAAGLSAGAIRRHLEAHRWQKLHRGVYATFNGPVPRLAQFWAAVHAAGEGAVLCGLSVAELLKLTDHPSPAVHVMVPSQRRVVPLDGVEVYRARHVGRTRRPSGQPPQTTVEETVIDLAQSARDLEDAYGWFARAVNGRLTTPARLIDAIRLRPRLRWRRLLLEGLGDVEAGCRSVLEMRYLNRVERAHGLPAGERQARLIRGMRRNYLDVRYRQFRTTVELDGEAAHPYHLRFRDRRRDNAGVVAGSAVLRYGTADIERDPCGVASEVSSVLRREGWRGSVRHCDRASCTAPASDLGK
jgi:hypothetical protein